MEIKPITNKSEYEMALSEIDRLMSRNPVPGSSEAKTVVLLSTLIEKYEKERFFFEKPTPIEAILFRMEEQGLDRNDLVPYIGSKGKVSEILSGKRPLSLNMIKALSKGLDIPADILLGEGSEEVENEGELDLESLPLKEMVSRGWLKSGKTPSAILQFVQPLMKLSPQVLYRRAKGDKRVNGTLVAWLSRVLNVSYEKVPLRNSNYKKEFVTKSLLKEVANLSFLDEGPLLAIELLGKNGIIVIVEKFLTGLKVDGASLLREDGTPVIALSLRHDRLDNFWFTILHELAHVFRHLSAEQPLFYDDLDQADLEDLFEKEADFLAKDSFVPLNVWKNSSVLKDRSEAAVIELSRRLRIHTSVIVGRLQNELKNYKTMRNLLGEGTVRKLFGVS